MTKKQKQSLLEFLRFVLQALIEANPGIDQVADAYWEEFVSEFRPKETEPKPESPPLAKRPRRQPRVQPSFIKSCRRQGWSYERIGVSIGVSRQRVEQILHSTGIVYKKPRTVREKKPRLCLTCRLKVDGTRSFCESCYKKRSRKLQRMHYKLNPERRARQKAATKKWMLANPEKVKIMQERASRKYRERRKKQLTPNQTL